MTISSLKEEREIPALVTDHQGLITWVNQPFEQVFGWKQEEVLGKPLTVIIPTKLHDAHHLGFSRFLTTGKGQILNQPVKLRTVNRTGQEMNAEHVILAEKNASGEWEFGARIRPVE